MFYLFGMEKFWVETIKESLVNFPLFWRKNIRILTAWLKNYFLDGWVMLGLLSSLSSPAPLSVLSHYLLPTLIFKRNWHHFSQILIIGGRSWGYLLGKGVMFTSSVGVDLRWCSSRWRWVFISLRHHLCVYLDHSSSKDLIFVLCGSWSIFVVVHLWETSMMVPRVSRFWSEMLSISQLWV